MMKRVQRDDNFTCVSEEMLQFYQYTIIGFICGRNVKYFSRLAFD